MFSSQTFSGEETSARSEEQLPVSFQSPEIQKVVYQMQASQWAIRAKVHMRRKRTAAPYSE